MFRNPLADPYLLGVAAGAGLGATLAIDGTGDSLGRRGRRVPPAAFAGALPPSGSPTLLGVERRPATPNASLILAGVAVAALFTAAQTFLLQRDDEAIRDVYAWLLGQFNVAGWDDVALFAAVRRRSLGRAARSPARQLDVMTVGDEEAAALGVRPGRVRLIVVVAHRSAPPPPSPSAG